MNDFLIIHNKFAYWGFFFLMAGLLLTWAWAWSFKRLRRVKISADQRRWEAWRGVAAAVAWMMALALILILLRSSYDINCAELVAMSDGPSPTLLENIETGRSVVTAPALVTFAVALGSLLIAGWWSGSWQALRTREDDDG